MCMGRKIPSDIQSLYSSLALTGAMIRIALLIAASIAAQIGVHKFQQQQIKQGIKLLPTFWWTHLPSNCQTKKYLAPSVASSNEASRSESAAAFFSSSIIWLYNVYCFVKLFVLNVQ